jgi:predicted GNAT family acetyltransferase
MHSPTIRILEPCDEAALEAFLLPRVESSMFLIGNQRAAGLLDRGQRYQGTYAAAFEGGEMVAVAAHFWNRNLVFQAPSHLDALWRRAVEASGRAIAGLIGPADQVGAVRAALPVDEADVQMDETENLYSLDLEDLRVPEDLRSGRLQGRLIRDGDLDLVTEWMTGYAIEALGERDSPELREGMRAGTRRHLEEENTWVLEQQGKPVACSSFNTAIAEAVQVGGVWTPPTLRSRGYGRAVVAASLLDARAEGVGTAILFTGEENVPAQRAYQALGFRWIGEYRLVLLRRPQD